MEQDMKLYFEKSWICSQVDQCVAMMKSILNSLLCLKMYTWSYIHSLCQKKL